MATSTRPTRARQRAATLGRPEELKNADYGLAPGGSIDGNQPGYFDMPDVDNDGVVDFTRRWEVLDVGAGKVMRFRVFSLLAAYGPAKDSMMTALVARR